MVNSPLPMMDGAGKIILNIMEMIPNSSISLEGSFEISKIDFKVVKVNLN